MRQILKKLFIVFLAAVTVITITACGKSNKKKKKDYVVSPNLNYDEYEIINKIKEEIAKDFPDYNIYISPDIDASD